MKCGDKNVALTLLTAYKHMNALQDGRPFYVVAPCHAMHQQRCLEAVGVWDEMTKADLPVGYDVYADSDEWDEGITCILGTYPLTDPLWIDRIKNAMKKAFLQVRSKHSPVPYSIPLRFCSICFIFSHVMVKSQLFPSCFLSQRPAAEWERIFISMKIPGAATQTTKEWLNSEHARSSGLVTQRRWSPDGPVVREAGKVVWSDRSKVPGSEALRQESMAIARRNVLEEGDPFLKGTRVVDLTNVIAGPTIGGCMSRFGATVIKVDPAKPTYDGLVAVYMGVPINTSKRSMLVDVKKTDDGKEVLRKLVEWADVVVTNQVPAQHRKLGIDEASLKAINPHIIHTNFDGFGGPKWGPRSDAVGYDDLLQASYFLIALLKSLQEIVYPTLHPCCVLTRNPCVRHALASWQDLEVASKRPRNTRIWAQLTSSAVSVALCRPLSPFSNACALAKRTSRAPHSQPTPSSSRPPLCSTIRRACSTSPRVCTSLESTRCTSGTLPKTLTCSWARSLQATQRDWRHAANYLLLCSILTSPA